MFSVLRDAAVLWTMDSRGTMFGELERGVKEDWEHVLRFERRQWLIFREVLEFWGRFFVHRDIRDTMFDGLERKVKEDWEFVLWFERRQWLIRREELDKFWGRLMRLILTLSSVNTLSVQSSLRTRASIWKKTMINSKGWTKRILRKIDTTNTDENLLYSNYPNTITSRHPFYSISIETEQSYKLIMSRQ